ncbi:MAG: hypothetical protein NC132_03235 [Corallococcus sp.]|nr:hypothetical protein [Corallococcus sp.]MCM1359518.1 hypothetical protein [Corallococcus sp.]MCM1395110.1 hypothetical protein [Corallococcus sp.]
MKRALTVLIVFTVLLSLATTMFACRDTDSDDEKVFYTHDSLSSYALTTEQEQYAREQFLQLHPLEINEGATIENVKVRKCFGQVNGKIVLSFDWLSSNNFVICRIDVAYLPVMISDVPIDLMWDLALLYNGKVYKLEDAFEQSILNHSELVAIAFATWGTEDLQQFLPIEAN